jgi:flagellar biosynthesis protein FliQ
MEELIMPTKFENLETLRKAAWDSFATRRAVEWRVSLAFWSVLAAFIYGVATDKIGAIPQKEKIVLTIIPIFIATVHISWLSGLWRADRFDKMEEGFLRDEMRREIQYKEPTELTDLRDKIVGSMITRKRWKHWSFAPKAVATIALTILAIFSIWLHRAT